MFCIFIDPRRKKRQQDLHRRRVQDLQETVMSSSSQSQSVSVKLVDGELLASDHELLLASDIEEL